MLKTGHGRKEGRKEGRREGRKEGRKLGHFSDKCYAFYFSLIQPCAIYHLCLPAVLATKTATS